MRLKDFDPYYVKDVLKEEWENLDRAKSALGNSFEDNIQRQVFGREQTLVKKIARKLEVPLDE